MVTIFNNNIPNSVAPLEFGTSDRAQHIKALNFGYLNWILLQRGDTTMISLGSISTIFMFIYEALVFATEYTIFLILIISMYHAVLLILSHLRDGLIIWSVLLVGHLMVRFFQSAQYPYF